MTALFRALGMLFRALTGLAFTVLIASVLLQVFSRLLLPRSPVWTEELSRFALLYMVAAGCGLAIRSGDLVNVDLVTNLLPGRWRSVLELLVLMVVIGFLGSLIMPAWKFVQIGAMQTSPALGWSMNSIHFTVLLAPISLILFALERCWTVIGTLGRGA